MNWAYAIVTYVVLWWLVLFMVLPIGVRSPTEANRKAEPGHDPGAPVKPMILRKILATTLVAAVLLGVVMLIQHYNLISFRTPAGS